MPLYKLERGLFKFEVTDYYAVLGLPLNADSKQIRKRYLQVVQKLHPDTCKATNEAEKEQANQLLSKLVNPAYEHLQKDRSRAEYQLIFPQIGQRLSKDETLATLQGEKAKELVNLEKNVLEAAYEKNLQEMRTNQYQDISKTLERISELSEMNLVYLLKKYGSESQPSPATQKTGRNENTASQTTSTASPQRNPRLLGVEPYTRRAQEHIEKNNFAKAILELREGLKIDPNHSTCHSLMGWAYLKQNQLKMAQIHIGKALQSNPQEELALKGKQVLDNLQKGSTDSKSSKASSGGLLGGLFGGKKK